MNRRMLGALTALPLALTAFGTASANAAGPHLETQLKDGIYIVQMADLPVVAYDGRVAGLPATRPAKGKKVDPLSPAVTRYVEHLKGKHLGALKKVGASGALYNYAFTYNGFAAKLKGNQAAALAKQPGVLAVSEQQTYSVDTSTTPSFLELDKPGGIWDQLGGTKGAGENVVIGIVDSGIWPEAPSFSDRVDASGKPSTAPGAKLAYRQIPGWNARCQVGERWTGKNCNQKLIAARYFNEGQGGNAGIDKDKPWEFNSARDYNGHGTHTASTSGGNYATSVTGQTSVLAPKGISGMAPRARIAAYKALWSVEDASTATGTTSDLVAAIDAAVADGVDVINYSISGSQTNFADPAEIAFLFAADAGVFVAASAGNSGPAASTVAHPSPWVTTVAAGTHNRATTTTLTLGDGSRFTGPSLADHAVSGDFVYAGDVAAADATAKQAQLCYSSADGGLALDPAKVKGKIVLCDRGDTARVNKSLAVKEAGGIGMVLVNIPGGADGLNADFHAVPSVHLPIADSAALHTYAASPGATATIDKFTLRTDAPAPFTADFSSRGPLRAGGGDILKPDIIAPGQDILAAVSPASNTGDGYNLYSGTSMSSPHIAGIAALFKDRHPDWSPMAIKSALMTTAYDVKDATSAAAKAFSQGAGHVDPNRAVNPGLVYDSSWNDWLAFLCGSTKAVGAASCDALTKAGYSTDASDMNVPSIAIGDLAGSQTVTRKVTNVSGKAATFTAKASVPGFKVTVSPATLTLKKGETAKFTVTITTDGAAINKYAAGTLTWTSGDVTARSPIVVRPVALSAPAEVTATSSGSASYDVTFGYSGDFAATARGLIKSTETPGEVADDPTDDFNTAPDESVAELRFTITPGTTYARWSLFGAGNPDDDLDLYLARVVNGKLALVGSSGNAGSVEEVNLVNPPAGQYVMFVHGWGVVSGSTPTPFTLHSWLLGSDDAGNLTVTAPTSASTGDKGTVKLDVSALGSGKWLGSVAYTGADGMPNPTIVRVDVP